MHTVVAPPQGEAAGLQRGNKEEGYSDSIPC